MAVSKLSSLERILFAHMQTKKTIVLHGSSGFGKTASVNQYVRSLREHMGMDVDIFVERTSTLDPLNMFLPTNVNDNSPFFKEKPSEWVYSRLLNPSKPTVIFFDEYNRPSSRQVYDLLMEMLGERSLKKNKISDLVQFIAAGNLAGEDTNVVENNDALLKRATHYNFAPSQGEIAANMRYAIAGEILTEHPSIVRVPGYFDLGALEGVSRNVDDLVEIHNTGVLSDTDFEIVCKGRLGVASGIVFCEKYLSKIRGQTNTFPTSITVDNLGELALLERSGKFTEVAALIDVTLSRKNRTHLETYLVATYLLNMASVAMAQACADTVKRNADEYAFPIFGLVTPEGGYLKQNLQNAYNLANGLPEVDMTFGLRDETTGEVYPEILAAPVEIPGTDISGNFYQAAVTTIRDLMINFCLITNEGGEFANEYLDAMEGVTADMKKDNLLETIRYHEERAVNWAKGWNSTKDAFYAAAIKNNEFYDNAVKRSLLVAPAKKTKKKAS